MSAVEGGPTVDIDMDVPDGWRRHDDAPGVVLLARPDTWHGEPSPSLNVAATQVPVPASFTDYVDLQLAGLAATFGGTLLHLDKYDGDPAVMEIGLAYELLGTDLTTVQRHLVDPAGNALVATGTAADVDWPAVGPALTLAARSLQSTRR